MDGHKDNSSTNSYYTAQEEEDFNEKQVSTPIEDKVLAKFEDIANDINLLTKLIGSVAQKSKKVMTQKMQQKKNDFMSLATKSGTGRTIQPIDEGLNVPNRICCPTKGSNVSGVCGLNNLGDTCYLNSVLQCLSNIRPLTEFVEMFALNICFDGQSLLKPYCQLIRQLWSTNSSNADPKEFHSVFLKLFPMFHKNEPKDCSELLKAILNSFHEELAQFSIGRPNSSTEFETVESYQKNNNTIISNNFHGIQRQQLVCNCGQIQMEDLLTFDVLNLSEFNGTDTRILIIRLVIDNKQINEIELRFSVPQISIEQLLKNVSKIYSDNKWTLLDDNHLIAIQVLDNTIQNIYESNDTIEIKDISGVIYIYRFDPSFPIHTFVLLFSHHFFGIPLLLDIGNSSAECMVFTEQFKQNLLCTTAQENEELFGIKLIDAPFISNWSGFSVKSTDWVNVTIESKYRIPEVIRLNTTHSSQTVSIVKLQNYLKQYSAIHDIREEFTLFCDNCQKTTALLERLQILKAPNVLTIRLDASARYKSCFQSFKCVIPLVLDFGPYLLDRRPFGDDFIYDLIGSINRTVIDSQIHYSSYSNNHLNNKWYHFNDNSVIEVNESEVISANNYLLFYLKR